MSPSTVYRMLFNALPQNTTVHNNPQPWINPILVTIPTLPTPLTLISEELYENEDFGSRDLAAVVASKVFYHLEELDDSLRYAQHTHKPSLFHICKKNKCGADANTQNKWPSLTSASLCTTTALVIYDTTSVHTPLSQLRPWRGCSVQH